MSRKLSGKTIKNLASPSGEARFQKGLFVIKAVLGVLILLYRISFIKIIISNIQYDWSKNHFLIRPRENEYAYH